MGFFFQDIRYFFLSWPKSGGQGIKTNCYFNSDLNMKLHHAQLVYIVQINFQLPHFFSVESLLHKWTKRKKYLNGLSYSYLYFFPSLTPPSLSPFSHSSPCSANIGLSSGTLVPTQHISSMMITMVTILAFTTTMENSGTSQKRSDFGHFCHWGGPLW